METKICCDCKFLKPLSSFSPRWQYKHGKKVGRNYLISYCRVCISKRSQAWQKKHVDKFKKYQKFYHEAKKLKS